MGIVGGLIAAPCTGPFLLGLLAYVATTHDVLRGGSMLFTYALGMGLLFFALAMFAVSLPKSRPLVEWVKSAAGSSCCSRRLYYPLAARTLSAGACSGPRSPISLGALDVAVDRLLAWRDPPLVPRRRPARSCARAVASPSS